MFHPKAFGIWSEHLNRAHAHYQQRIVVFPAEEQQEAAFGELREFIHDAAAWCQHEQDRGTCRVSPFMESREAEVIASVHGLLDRLVIADDARCEMIEDCQKQFHAGRVRFYLSTSGV